MAARNAVRHVVAAVSKTGLMPSGYQVLSAAARPRLHEGMRSRQTASSEPTQRVRRGRVLTACAAGRGRCGVD
jgi:hypothetical protein